MTRLLVLVLATLVAIWLVMAAVTPGRQRPAAEPDERPRLIEIEPARPAPAPAEPADPAGLSASELAPDAQGDTPAAAPDTPGPAQPGPELLPSPQYPDTIPPEPDADMTATAEAGPDSAIEGPAAGARRVTGARVNLRAGPGTGHAVLGAVVAGELVTPLAPEAEGWQQVRTEAGAEGWLATQFLSAPLP